MYLKMDKSQDAISLYDVVTYAGYKWFVIKIGNDDVTLLAKNDDFGRLRFDRESSDYQNSEIRKHINSVLANILTKNGAELETASLKGLDDKVFLLSEEEAEELPTNIRKFSDWWWLRSPGNDSNYAVYVGDDGSVFTNGSYVNYDLGCIRPAIIVKTDNLRKSFEPEPIVDKAIRIAEDIVSEINNDPFLQSEPSFSKEVECCIEHWMYRDEEESAIEDDWIARQSRILDIFQSHGLLFKAIYPGFRRLAGYDTLSDLVSSYLVFSHKVGSGIITAKVDKDRKISGGVTIFR
jgi:hypothetical protein